MRDTKDNLTDLLEDSNQDEEGQEDLSELNDDQAINVYGDVVDLDKDDYDTKEE